MTAGSSEGRRLPAAALSTLRAWLPRGHSLPAADWQTRHRWLVALLWGHVPVLPLVGIHHGYSAAHSVAETSVIAVLATVATFAPWPSRWRAAVAALGLVSASAMLVHFTNGLIEAHFHFFVVILLLALYEDWIPFLIALGYVVVHHGVAGQFSPESVYNHPDAIAHPWKWAAIHGAFVAAASVGAVIAWRLNEVTRARAAEATANAVRSQEANAMKSRFLATTSHELRTPLTSISGFATTLRHRWEDVHDVDKLRMLEIIEAQSGRLGRLIEDLLVLSAAESGNVPVRQALVDVSAAVQQVVWELGARDDVVVEVPEDAVARVDERHIGQIVANLISNALKYGAAPIVVSAARVNGWLELAVADHGDGVAEDFRPQLFESFARAADAMSEEGTGLGLSVVRGLVQANGGDVRYEPNEPRGARFVVRLPPAVEARTAAGEDERRSRLRPALVQQPRRV